LNTSRAPVGGLNTPGRVDHHRDQDDARGGTLLDKLGQRIDRSLTPETATAARCAPAAVPRSPDVRVAILERSDILHSVTVEA
jgi:hypothetical protein